MTTIDRPATRQAITPPPLCDMDPKQLSSHERNALDLIGRMRLYRTVRNRYGQAPNSLGHHMVIRLVALGLVRVERGRGRYPYPVLTGSGRVVLDVIEQRRKP